MIISTICCRNSEKKILELEYSKDHFVKNLNELLRSNRLDSLTYYKGLVLQSNSELTKEWDGLFLDQVIDLIRKKTELNGMLNFDEIIDGNLKVSLEKKIGKNDSITYELDVDLLSGENFEIGDELLLKICHENLRGKKYSEIYLRIEVDSTLKEGSEKSVQYKQNRNDMIRKVMIKKERVKDEVPESVFIKFETMKIVECQHYRGNILKSKILR